MSERNASKLAAVDTQLRERLDRADMAHQAHLSEIRRKAVSENMKVPVLLRNMTLLPWTTCPFRPLRLQSWGLHCGFSAVEPPVCHCPLHGR